VGFGKKLQKLPLKKSHHLFYNNKQNFDSFLYGRFKIKKKKKKKKKLPLRIYNFSSRYGALISMEHAHHPSYMHR